MPTNSTILTAFNSLLANAALGYPIAWQGVDFNPPGIGMWLEASFFPNEGRQSGLSNAAQLTPEGIYQVTCYSRPGVGGVVPLQAVADAVRAAFPKGQVISGPVRVTRTPYDMQFTQDDDRIAIAVTVPYLG